MPTRVEEKEKEHNSTTKLSDDIFFSISVSPKDKEHSLLGNVHIMAREGQCFKSGVKEANCVKLNTLNRGGGQQHHFSVTYNAFLASLPRQCNSHLHSCNPNNTHDGLVGQRPM